MNRDETKFWSLLLFLNFLLFLPGYLFNADTSHFFPWQGFTRGSPYERIKTIFVRSNLDTFRISVDLFLLVLLYYACRKYIGPVLYGWFAGIYYFLMFLFLTYFTGFEKLYHIPPVIYHDISMLKLGFFNIGGSFSIRSGLFLFLFVAVVLAIVWIVRLLIHYTYRVKFSKYSYGILLLLGFLLLVNSLKSGITYSPMHTFQATSALMAINIKNSAEAHSNLGDYNVDRINEQHDFNSIELKSKPDVYLLFIESYGKILFRNKLLKDYFNKCLDSCEYSLRRGGWNMASAFSVSPVSGGKSWISYTSVMFGFNIRNQGTYNYLLKDTSMARYNNIFNILRKWGYKTFRLNAMPQISDMVIPWDTYSRFYSIDRWINFEDLKYSGRLYGFGPSPPDQYSINFAGEWIQKNYPGPHALFFITQTTHHPYYGPSEVKNDWRMLNNDRDSIDTHASVFLKKPRIGDYLKAICYEWSTLSRFISTNVDSNSVFILVGDHQPAVLAGKQDGFETPVHIISQNSEFVSAFRKYGFHIGLNPGTYEQPIHHEGICSMFLREFARLYGRDTVTLPAYRPYGLITNSL